MIPLYSLACLLIALSFMKTVPLESDFPFDITPEEISVGFAALESMTAEKREQILLLFHPANDTERLVEDWKQSQPQALRSLAEGTLSFVGNTPQEKHWHGTFSSKAEDVTGPILKKLKQEVGLRVDHCLRGKREPAQGLFSDI